MKQIDTISSEAYQSLYFITEDGIQLHFTLRFFPRNQQWVLDLESDDFNVYGLVVCCNGNLLDKFHNLLTYGIVISTIDGLDPWRVTDFEDGNASFYVLNKDELKSVTGFLNGEQSD